LITRAAAARGVRYIERTYNELTSYDHGPLVIQDFSGVFVKPAILVPYKNRQQYLDIFLDKVPKYLEQINGIKDYMIYIAEQISSDIFNLSLSRNVAGKFALLDDPAIDCLIFHDVDAIPLQNIDYRMADGVNIAWFMTAGSCKIFKDAFLQCNGYNPQFAGWGCEDVDFYERLGLVNRGCHLWHRTNAAREAVFVNLEMPDLPQHEAQKWYQNYFGHSGAGPRFISPSQAYTGLVLKRRDKSDFLIPALRQQNEALRDQICRLAPAERWDYVMANGLNLVELSNVSVKQRSEKIVWLTYDSTQTLLDILRPRPHSSASTRQRVRAQQLRRKHRPDSSRIL